jgi:AcrR family transcriptional regulator
VDKTERYHHGNVPEAIVKVALEQLEHREVGELSLRGLAREIGVSPTAVYRHFADKTELAAAIADRGFARLAERFEAACPIEDEPGSPEEARRRLADLGQAYLEFAVSTPELFRLMFGREAADYRRRRAMEPGRLAQDTRVHTFKYIEKTMAALAITGVVKEVSKNDVYHAWAVIHGYAHLLVGDEAVAAPAVVAEEAAARIIASAGLGIHSPAGPSP